MATCPVSQELLAEKFTPRGKIQLARYYSQGELDLSDHYQDIYAKCLLCRACVVTCPSGVDLNKVRVGKTVDLNHYEKDNPRDFTLLKRSTLHELKSGIFFTTNWGKVRPSWHIECAAVALKALGDTFDIHTGSTDLIFPLGINIVRIIDVVLYQHRITLIRKGCFE